MTESINLKQSDSEVAKLMQTIDWAATILGPVESWSCSLQTAVSICLSSRLPTVVLGGSQSVLIYNDAYVPFLGMKHPAALGRPAAEVLYEIWDVAGPMLEGVRQTGKTTGFDDSLILVNRSGFLEEHYFTFSYTPIGMGSNSIFAFAFECTADVVSKRRMQTIQNLSTCLVEHTNMDVLCSRVMGELEKNNTDIPFALLYLIDSKRQTGSLVGTASFNNHEAFAPTYSLQAVDEKSSETFRWPLAEVASSGKSKVVDVRHLLGLPHGHWDKSPSHVILVSITAPGQDLPTAILVAAVSPVRTLDESYINFYDSIATHIALAIANTCAYEEAFQRAEALAEIDRAKTLFFTNISHEFRTPLTLILGPLDDVLNNHERVISARQREAIVLAKRNALRLLKLVNTLLDFSRLEAGRTEAIYRPCYIDTLTAELIGVFRSAIEKAGLVLEVEMEALNELVYVDWDMWEKIVSNLLSNALKYTHKGTIRVTFKKVDKNVEFGVSDTGVGIPDSELSKIFQRFYRAHNVHGRSFEGSGIGLSLIEELIKMHGGTIRVASKPSEGSVFTVSIPRGFAHLPQDRIRNCEAQPTPTMTATTFAEETMHWFATSESKSSPEREGTLPAISLQANLQHFSGKPCILLADDNADMRNYVTRLLQDDYQVIAVADGKAALEAVLLRKPQLVLSDVMMPKMDGFELIHALRSNPVTERVPIILLSARAGEEAKVEGLAFADDYICKPFSAKELLARIKTHLELGQLRLRLEEAVEKGVHELKVLTRISPVGMYRTDPLAKLVYINEKGCQILGLTLEEALGHGWHRAVHSDDKERVLSTIQQSRDAANDYLKLEYRVSHSNQTLEVIADVAVERNNDGVVIGYVGTLTDITELRVLERAHFEAIRSSEEQQRKRAEDAEQHRKALEVFVDTMCHELRNPLNGIYGNVNLVKASSALLKSELQTGNLEEIRPKIVKHIWEEEEAFSSIEKCVRYQKVITDDVLSLSKLEAGKLELNYANFKPNQLVKDILNMIERQAKDKSLRFHFDLLPTDMVIRADPNRITQILLNLLTNAIKFSPQDSGEITIRIKPLPNNSLLQVAVEDNGIGMTEEEKRRLFDRFSQANRKTSAEYGGSGLGLTITKNLVSLMGGEINVESVKGKGTKISFTFQYLPGKDIEAKDHQSMILAPQSSSSIEGKRILIVEDNVINQKILIKQLTQAGCQCIVANNGQEALDSFETNPLDLVFMDIEMPVLNGLEATRAIRKREQELQRTPAQSIPIIGLSGNARPEQKVIAMSSGMNDYLVKPYEKTTLLSTIVRFTKSEQDSSSAAGKVFCLASHAEQEETVSITISSALISDGKKSENISSQPSFLPTEDVASTSFPLSYAKAALCELTRITSLENIVSSWTYKQTKNTFYLATKTENGVDPLKRIHHYFKKNGLSDVKLTQTQILCALLESGTGTLTTLKLKVENVIQLKAIPAMVTENASGAVFSGFLKANASDNLESVLNCASYCQDLAVLANRTFSTRV